MGIIFETCRECGKKKAEKLSPEKIYYCKKCAMIEAMDGKYIEKLPSALQTTNFGSFVLSFIKVFLPFLGLGILFWKLIE